MFVCPVNLGPSRVFILQILHVVFDAMLTDQLGVVSLSQDWFERVCPLVRLRRDPLVLSVMFVNIGSFMLFGYRPVRLEPSNETVGE